MFNREMTQAEGTSGKALSHRLPSLSDRLLAEKERLTERLSDVNEAIAAIENQPGLKEVLDAVGRLGHM